MQPHTLVRLTIPLSAVLILGCQSDLPLRPPLDAATSARDASLASAGTMVLRGTIITPGGVLKHGYVGIVDGRIVAVSDRQPDVPGAIVVDTEGIIVPGFVDVHNHVPWNVLPRWKPGRLFSNRSQWRADTEYLQVVATPFERLLPTRVCDMNAWGELRALVGGTTATMTTRPVSCIHGLVRNLDYNSGFYGTTELNREHIFDVLELPPATNPDARAAFAAAAGFFIANPFYEALVMHVAEGTDEASEEEFTFLNTQSLLNPKGALIHGIPLDANDFGAMAAAGTALVWSPRSNLELYGATANVTAALDAGVEIALAPDWALTGSSNMLDELKVASSWNREQLGGRLTDRQLIDMATSVAARIVGVDDEVGAIRPGLRADLVVIKGRPSEPYRAIIEAGPEDVLLVTIQGVPLYGSLGLMKRFWTGAELEELPLSGGPKVLASPVAGVVVAEVAARLAAALQAEGTSLAPLTESPPGRPAR